MNPLAKLADIGEVGLLRHLRRRIPSGPGVVVGPGDDAAVVETAALTLVTTDSLVEGVHFRREWSPPRLLGRKALSVSLSDIGAMSGVPRHALVSLCLPPDYEVGWLDGLYDGLLERAAETGVSLVGGNLSAIAGPAVIDVTLLGQASRFVTRAGAKPEDLIVVTGSLGAAAEGLKLLAQGARLDENGELCATGVWTDSSTVALTDCLQAQLDPRPPLAFARALAENPVVHAAIDLSDGLSGDLLRLCEESGLQATIESFAVPVSPQAASLERARGGDALSLALHGGEDYQLLVAVPRQGVATLKDVAVIWDLPVTVIGELSAGEPRVMLKAGSDQMLLATGAHEHFGLSPGNRGV